MPLISKKPLWDSYVGDATKYTITKEEALRRQKERVSKHNVLLSEVTPTKTRSNIKRIKIKQNIDSKKPSSSSSVRKYKHKEMSSLDLVNNKETDAMPDIATFLTQPVDADETETSINKKNNHVSFSSSSHDDEADNDVTVDLKMNTTDISNTINNTINNTIAYDNIGVKVQREKKGFSSTAKRSDQQRVKNRSMNISNSFKMSQIRFKNSSSTLEANSGSHSAELEDIVQQIRSLNGELRYYEQLSGRRSVFDAEELEVALEAMLDENSAKVSATSVMRYLVQLVCQSMSYLLQSQIDIAERDAKFESLTEKVNLLTRIVLPSDDNKPQLGKKRTEPQTPSTNTTNEVKTPAHSRCSATNGSHISPVTPSSSTAMNSPEIAFNLSIAATPLTTKAGSDIIERSKMNGSSPTDWLFASSHLSVNKNSESPLRLFSNSSQFTVPPTNNLVDDSYKLAETIVGHEENDGQFDEVSTNLMSKFMSSVSSQSKNDVINFTDAMNSQSIEESRMRELYAYLSERGILNSPARASSSELPSPADAPSMMPPIPESLLIHPYKKTLYDARIGHYDAM